jgi:hypothetical protein
MKLLAALALALVGCGRCDEGKAGAVSGSIRARQTDEVAKTLLPSPVVTFQLGRSIVLPSGQRAAKWRPYWDRYTFDELKVQKVPSDWKVERMPDGLRPGTIFELSGTFTNEGEEKCFASPLMVLTGDGRPLGDDGPPRFFSVAPDAHVETNRSRHGVAPHETVRVVERYVAPEAERRFIFDVDTGDDKGNVTWLMVDLEDGHCEETVANVPPLVPSPIPTDRHVE